MTNEQRQARLREELEISRFADNNSRTNTLRRGIAAKAEPWLYLTLAIATVLVALWVLQ